MNLLWAWSGPGSGVESKKVWDKASDSGHQEGSPGAHVGVTLDPCMACACLLGPGAGGCRNLLEEGTGSGGGLGGGGGGRTRTPPQRRRRTRDDGGENNTRSGPRKARRNSRGPHPGRSLSIQLSSLGNRLLWRVAPRTGCTHSPEPPRDLASLKITTMTSAALLYQALLQVPHPAPLFQFESAVIIINSHALGNSIPWPLQQS